MSPRSSSSQGPYRKPRPDVYTVLLILALMAVLLSVLFLNAEVKGLNHPQLLSAPALEQPLR